MMLKIGLLQKQFSLLLLSSLLLLQINSNAYTATNQITPSLPEEALFFDQEIGAIPLNETYIKRRSAKKPWTIIVYMAADNDLRNFATRNLKQMASIGSSEYLNIVVHLDIRISGNKKVTRRYFIEKDRILHVNAQDGEDYALDSGDPATLISCCNWAIKDYPAQDYALIFWNHGSGIIDPSRGRIINPAELFTFNPTNHKLELDRSVGFLDLVTQEKNDDQRGICWDESTGNYLTNQKLEYALKEICTKQLLGGKFSIIGFDACLMSMLEVASLVRPYAEVMVGSQEVELGTGWNYAHVLYPFAQQSLSKLEFATHIVAMYEKTYKAITQDYTQSAIDLANVPNIERSLHEISRLILEATPLQTNNSIKTAVRDARKKNSCTHFDEPSYIDLSDFYTNLLRQIPYITLQNSVAEIEFKKSLKSSLEIGIKTIKATVVANVCGSNLQRATGISIYFPERKTHQSYALTDFAKNNAWSTLIAQYTEPQRTDHLDFLDAIAR